MSSLDASGVTESIANLSITVTDIPPESIEQSEEQTTPRQGQGPSTPQQLEAPLAKESDLSEEDLNSGSDTEKEASHSTNKMPSGSSSSKHHSSSSSSSKKHSSSSSSRRHTKDDDWSDVTEPEERRRIQNRIAQRKFRESFPSMVLLSQLPTPSPPAPLIQRPCLPHTNLRNLGEKAREQKERQDREARNQELAGSSYAVPEASDLAYYDVDDGTAGADELSGLPWGGLNIPHMVARGHAASSGSQQGGSQQQQPSSHQYGSGQQYDHQQAGGSFYDPQQFWDGGSGGSGAMSIASYGGGGYGDAGDDRYFDTSASSSSPSYFSYDAFSGDGGSSSGTMQ